MEYASPLKWVKLCCMCLSPGQMERKIAYTKTTFPMASSCYYLCLSQHYFMLEQVFHSLHKGKIQYNRQYTNTIGSIQILPWLEWLMNQAAIFKERIYQDYINLKAISNGSNEASYLWSFLSCTVCALFSLVWGSACIHLFYLHRYKQSVRNTDFTGMRLLWAKMFAGEVWKTWHVWGWHQY